MCMGSVRLYINVEDRREVKVGMIDVSQTTHLSYRQSRISCLSLTQTDWHIWWLVKS